VSPDEPVVGKVGTVTHPIVGGRAGEVVVRIRGGTETFIAYADADLPAKSEVLVIKQRSARTVEVTPFDM
jgi:membrane protein implicated in regulation of membrane protease activity